jgi:hypothetical protein
LKGGGERRPGATGVPVGDERAALAEAYCCSTYRTRIDGRAVTIRVGEPVPALAGYGGWAWLTAVNPGSRPLPAAENAARLAALAQRLQDLGAPNWPADAVADDGGWPIEPGFVVAGIPLATARGLAVGFGQHAIVWGEAGLPSRLEWLPPPTMPAE